MESVKCVIIGDKNVGKTTLDFVYMNGNFNLKNKPIKLDDAKTIVTIDGKAMRLVITDTVCREGHDKLRPLEYPNTDVFLICFSLVNRESFANVLSKWYLEVHYYCPNIPIILVGTKLDLRENEEASGSQIKLTAINYQEGLVLSKKIGAVKYLECSALTQNTLNVVFDEAVRTTLKIPGIPKKSHKCITI